MADLISGVKIPDSKIAREAAELVRQHETEMLFNHSVRVFVFGAMKGIRQNLKFDSELLYVAALLSVSLVIVAVALISRLRDPRRVASSAAPLSDRLSPGHGRPAWRVLMIGAAVLVAWLIAVWLLSRFVGPHGIDQPQSAPQSGVPAPRNTTPRPPGSQDDGTDRDVVRYLIASTVALLAMIAAGSLAARRRRAVEPSVDVLSPISGL